MTLPERLFSTGQAARLALRPARAVAIAFLIAIVVGTILLSLPVAQAPETDLSLLDALFTATSAVCVTGLVLVDTGSAFSRFGQIVILVLIQLGGLGILALGSIVAFILRRRISYRQRIHMQASLNAMQVYGVLRLIRGILLFTFLAEFVGALILWWRFATLYGAREGAFQSLFHAVSAFNNAGFTLYPDSLERFAADPTVLLTIAGLFLLGGLGFLVAVDAGWHLLDRRKRLSLHSRIVLLTSGVLLLGATCLILGFEWSNNATMGNLSAPLKLLNAFFQAATPRTAGFNTLDYSGMREVSIFFTMVLMFIGANPASTGGGIKTVTAFVVFGSAISEVRGQDELEAFGRRIPTPLVLKAGTVALFSFFLIALVLLVLSVTDPGLRFIDIAFETFSAFGTVGLSTGVTASISDPGKVALVLLMYAGRLGPTTFALALINKERNDRVRYPAEQVIIG